VQNINHCVKVYFVNTV